MKRWAYFAIPLVLLAVLIAWRLSEKLAEKRAQAREHTVRLKAPPVVTVAPVLPRVIVRYFDSTGTVEAPFNVKIGPKTTGRIVYLVVREGNPVRNGETLVKLDPTEAEALVRQARGAVAEAQQRLVQAQLTRRPTNVNITQQIRQTRESVTSATADYEQATRNYKAQLDAATSAVRDAQAKAASASAAVTSAKANLANARAHYERAEQLYKQGYISAQDADDAQTQVDIQQASLNVAQEQLSSATAEKQSAQDQLNITRTTGAANIKSTRSRLEQARSQSVYAQSNVSQKAAYEHNLAALQEAVNEARQNLAAAEARLADTVLKSPVDGFVTQRAADPGSVVVAGTTILSVQAIRTVWVTVAVPEEESLQMRIGQTASVSFDALPGRMFTGLIVLINASADPSSRQFMVRVSISNPDEEIKPGIYANVTIITRRVSASAAIPLEGLRSDASGSYVMVIRNGRAYRRQVVPGLSDANYAAITQGLTAGDLVVTSSAYPLRNGQEVRFRRPAGARSRAGGAGY